MLEMRKHIRKSLAIKLCLDILFVVMLIFTLSLGFLYWQSRGIIRQEAIDEASHVLDNTALHTASSPTIHMSMAVPSPWNPTTILVRTMDSRPIPYASTTRRNHRRIQWLQCVRLTMTIITRYGTRHHAKRMPPAGWTHLMTITQVHCPVLR